MGANMNDEYTYSRSYLCYHDSQCQQPTRFYPRYLRDRQLGRIPNAGSPAVHGSSPDLRMCVSTMTSFADIGSCSLQRLKSSSLVNLNPGLASPKPRNRISSSTGSLPAVDPERIGKGQPIAGGGRTLGNRRDSDDESGLSIGRACKWQPSYASGCGKYSSRKRTDDVTEASYPQRRNESAGLRLPLLQKLIKARKWLSKVGRRHRRSGAGTRIASQYANVRDLSGAFHEQSHDLDVGSVSSTSSGSSSAIDGAICDRSTYSLPSLKDGLSDGSSNLCPKRLSRSVEGLLQIGDLENSSSYPS